MPAVAPSLRRVATGAALAVLAATAPPTTSGSAALVVAADSGEPLVAHNPDAHELIASTTKLMTALLTLERTRDDQIFAAPAYSASPAEVTIGLTPGERMTVHDLLRALLLPSANDSAVTLARGIAGSEAAFVQAMNARARALGLTSTHYSNPVGLDAPGNYSSARDLTRLASVLMRDPRFAAIVSLQTARLTSGNHPRLVVNRNSLLGRYPFVDGVKTGHTVQAGYVLVGAAQRDGIAVISAVTGEPSEAAQAADTVALLRYALSRLQRTQPVTAGAAVASARVSRRGGERVTLVPASTVSLVARTDAPPSVRLHVPAEVEGPLPRGARAGSLDVVYEGRVVRRVPLLTASAVRSAPPLARFGAPTAAALAALACLLLAGTLLRRRRRRPWRRVAHDHHRHAQRGNRQDARRAELPARAPPPRSRADLDGRRQGRQRRTRP